MQDSSQFTHGNPAEAEALTPAAGWRRTFSSLRVRSFRWYWVSLLAFFLAVQMRALARGWLVFDMTDSPLALGLVAAAWGAPMLVLSLFGGVVTDRVQKRNLLVVTQGLVGVITLVVTILIATDAIRLWHLIVASFCAGIVLAFNMPGLQAIIPELVGKRELLNAISLNASGMNFTRIAGPALAGVLVGIIGIAGVYFVTVACSAVAVGALLMVPTSGTIPRHASASVRRDLAEGLGYIRRSQILLVLLAMAFVPVFFGMPYLFLLPAFADDVFDVGAWGLGILMAVSGIGALVGSLTIASLGDFRRKGLLLLGLALGFGVTLVLFASTGSFYLSLFFLLFVGAGSTGYVAVNNTLVQSNVSDRVRGRVMSIYMMTFALMPLGTLPVGAIAEVVGIPLAVGGGGVVLVLFTIIVVALFPSLRRLE